MEKCKRCDRDGYISTGKGSRRSCACGYAIAQQKRALEGIPLRVLLEYAAGRIAEKQRASRR